MKFRIFQLCLLTLSLSLLQMPLVTADEPQFREVDVFTSGEDGYDTYRIPSVIKAANGNLLAFCEGRKNGRSDTGDIDLLMKRSTDGGKTWSKQQVLWNDEQNTCGNPCPVVVQSSGDIVLLLTWNSGRIHESRIATGFGQDSRRVFLSRSTNHGKSWDTPKDITSAVKDQSWSWYATGPGAGIQIQHGPHAGRIIIPCDHKQPLQDSTAFYSHVIYSDDDGVTWQLGGRSPEPKTNESEVVELTDGRLMLNMRNYRKGAKARQVCFSSDGGETWQDQYQDETLIEPICQASIRRITWPDGETPGSILFSNPAHKTKRRHMTVRLSQDDGKTWAHSRMIYKGDSAYSCLVRIKNGDVGCLYEKDGYRTITFAMFPLDWISATK